MVNSNNASLALAASDTYVQNFRRGSANVRLTGPGNIPLLAGTQVAVDHKRHAYMFGTAVPGVNSSNVSQYLGNGGTAQQTNYQSRLNQNFNALVPENMGKWSSNENTRDVNTMAGVDTILNYAQSNNMRARMHNMIWGTPATRLGDDSAQPGGSRERNVEERPAHRDHRARRLLRRHRYAD